jgi:hypothetical protein
MAIHFGFPPHTMRISSEMAVPTRNGTVVMGFQENFLSTSLPARRGSAYIALAQLDGLTKEQVATRLNRELRAVERKLKVIRAVSEEAD